MHVSTPLSQDSDMKNTTLCYIEQDGKYLMIHRVKKVLDENKDKFKVKQIECHNGKVTVFYVNKDEEAEYE